jgi:Zn-dependent peptidase ImmA (M78 family)
VTGPTVTRPVHFHRQAKGRKRLRDKVEESVIVGGTRIPRETQLLALAITFEDMIRTGEARNYAEIARRTGVSRARITQMLKILELAPEIQAGMLGPVLGEVLHSLLRAHSA